MKLIILNAQQVELAGSPMIDVRLFAGRSSIVWRVFADRMADKMAIQEGQAEMSRTKEPWPRLPGRIAIKLRDQ